MLVAVAVIWWAGRGVGFIGDEWGWIWGATHPSANWVLQDYNGHLQATTFLTFWLLLHAAGMAHLGLFRAATLALHLAVVAAVFVLIRRRVGPWLGIGGALLVAVLGTGADAFLTSLEIAIVFATAASLWALVAFDRNTLAGDLLACVLLVIALASFSSAVAFTAGLFVELMTRRDRWRRLWVVAVPALLYLGWRLHWAGSSNDVHGGGSPVHVVVHAYKAATGAFAGLAGIQLNSPTLRAHAPWAQSVASVALALLAGALAWSLARRRVVRPRLANMLVAGVVLWLLIALFRGATGDLYPSRYVYVGAVIALLIVVEALPNELLRDPRWQPLLATGILVSLALNAGWLVVWANHLRDESTTAKAQLAALELSRGVAPPGYVPSTSYGTGAITAGAYFASLERFGPAGPPAIERVRAAPPAARDAADQVLIGAGMVGVTPGTATPSGRLRLQDVSGATASVGRSCVALKPVVRALSADVSSPGPRLVVQIGPGGGALLLARRFGTAFHGIGDAVRAATISMPAAVSVEPWHVRVIANRPVRICGGPRSVRPN
jgi:hypothetical protein